MCDFISKEEALALAGDCPVEGLSQVAVADAVEKAHESDWYQRAKQWEQQPLPMGGETFPRACQFIVSVIDNGWNVMRALMEQYSVDVPCQVALLIEAILLGNFRAIYNANEICGLDDKIGFDIFIQVVTGDGDYSAFVPYMCEHFDSPAEYVTALLACDEKIVCLLDTAMTITTEVDTE